MWDFFTHILLTLGIPNNISSSVSPSHRAAPHWGEAFSSIWLSILVPSLSIIYNRACHLASTLFDTRDITYGCANNRLLSNTRPSWTIGFDTTCWNSGEHKTLNESDTITSFEKVWSCILPFCLEPLTQVALSLFGLIDLQGWIPARSLCLHCSLSQYRPPLNHVIDLLSNPEKEKEKRRDYHYAALCIWDF